MVSREVIERRANNLRRQTPAGYGLIAIGSPQTQVEQLRKIYRGKKLKVLKAVDGRGYNVYLKK